MRLFTPALLIALTTAAAIVSDPTQALAKRDANLDLIAYAGCTSIYFLCLARCGTIGTPHARQFCYASCLAVWKRTTREADNNDFLPLGIDEAPIIVRREESFDYHLLKECDAEVARCQRTVELTYGDPERADPDDWEKATRFCGDEFATCQREAGYAKYNGCPEP